MAKTRTVFVCQQCGHETPRWAGRCPGCGQWNTIVEEKTRSENEKAVRRQLEPGRSRPRPLTEIAASPDARLATTIGELDRILGGGIVRGSAVLIGGDPGIGKSTLLLQVADRLAACGATVLYVTAEESALQTRLRAERLGAVSDRVLLLAATDLDEIAEAIEKSEPALVVIDSVQAVYSQDITSAPGSVSQVRECAARFVYQAKRTGIPVFLVGHVTKGGVIAGPRLLEHMVDTVLYFEGDRFHAFRILRAVKNRFGSTNEIGVFEMRRTGLEEVANPSGVFLGERATDTSGSCVLPTIEGTRALLVEVQALLSAAHFGSPERKVSGADYRRVCMLLAVLERRVGLRLGGQDVFVNIAGGVRVDEPAADLSLAVSVASSFENFLVPKEMVVCGEVGLGGELRAVSQMEFRLREAARLGFKRAIIPHNNRGDYDLPADFELIPLKRLGQALDVLR